jgi:hypothetical protein
MSSVIDFEAWRRHREVGEEGALEEASPTDPSIARLEQAIQRLHGLVTLALDGRLETRVETELLAIMGELTVGLVPEAASRAERLADRLAAGKGGGRG